MRRICITLALLLLTPAARADSDPMRDAIAKGLRRIDQGVASYPNHRQCFSCHHQAMGLLSLSAARQRGFEVDAEKLQQAVEFTLATFRPKKEQILKGQGIGGANTTVVYALFSLEAAGHKPDETTAALVEFLLKRQKSDGSWQPVTKRPPTEESPFTDTGLAMRVLRAYGPPKEDTNDDLRQRIDDALAKGRDWLLANEPVSTEDRVFHLRGLIYAGVEKEKIEAARSQLLKEQRDDGGWAQLPEMDSDAYATGTVLTTLRLAGLPARDPAYERGVKYLLETQRDDGAWIVETRSKPIQVFFDNGDPGGKSQFISFASTAWAVMALLENFPAK